MEKSLIVLSVFIHNTDIYLISFDIKFLKDCTQIFNLVFIIISQNAIKSFGKIYSVSLYTIYYMDYFVLIEHCKINILQII